MVDATTTEKPHGPSYKGASEAIAKFWNSLQTERVYTPEEIYNYSPSGELFMIDGWYMEARLAGFRGDDDTYTDEEYKEMVDNMYAGIRKDLLQ